MSEDELNCENLLEAVFESMMRDLNKKAASYGMTLTRMWWNKQTRRLEIDNMPFEDIFLTQIERK